MHPLTKALVDRLRAVASCMPPEHIAPIRVSEISALLEEREGLSEAKEQAIAARDMAEESAEKARADAAALRNVLEDCHAHDIYASGDGAKAADLYRRSHGSDFGRVKDVSAHDHNVSMRKAVRGELGGEMLIEVRELRARVAEFEELTGELRALGSSHRGELPDPILTRARNVPSGDSHTITTIATRPMRRDGRTE